MAAANRLSAYRRKARRRTRKAGTYLLRAGIDAREAIRGERNPMYPPRRLGLPGQGRAIGYRVMNIALIGAAGLKPTDRVLDIGCGPGRNAVPLTGYLEGGSYEGFDVMPEAIRWAQRNITPRARSFRFQLAELHNAAYNSDATSSAASFRFPYADDSFDVVFSTSVYTHLQPLETENYLRETARVLAPGGRTVSTFFLIDDEVEQLFAQDPERRRRGGRLPAQLSHELTDERGQRYRTRDPRVPERELALYTEDAVAMHERAGLAVTEVRGGHWSGRERRPDMLGQDLIVASRAT